MAVSLTLDISIGAYCGAEQACDVHRQEGRCDRAGHGPRGQRVDNRAVIAATTSAGAYFSVTARMDRAVTAAITRIPEDAWVGIKYPQAIWEEAEQRWISEAEVAEVPYTAFTSRPKAQHVTARLIVRRVKRLNPTSVPAGQEEMFSTHRHHGGFTNSPLSMLATEASHRDHAIVEQVIADLKAGPLAHAPSGQFCTNGAWTVLTAIAYNLTRATATLVSARHARARRATIWAQLINIPARIANRTRRLRLHLPTNWPWAHPFDAMFNTALAQQSPEAWPLPLSWCCAIALVSSRPWCFWRGHCRSGSSLGGASYHPSPRP